MNNVLALFRRGFAHGRIGTRAQPLRQLCADLDAIGRLRARKRLIIGIHDDIFRAFQPRFNQAVDRIVSCAAHADDLDFRNARKVVCQRLLHGSGRLFPVGTVAVPRPVIIVISEIVDHLFFPPKMLKIL